MTLVVNSIPAKRGQWTVISLADGSSVKVELCGDEFSKYYCSADGECYVAAGGGVYKKADLAAVQAKGAVHRARTNARMAAKAKRRVAGADNAIAGEKKGLIILVQFSDTKFKTEHDSTFYNRVANEEGFTTSDGFHGSVCDYFRDQSLGCFNLTFDVAGPVTMPNGYAYYGANTSEYGDDYIGELVAYACQQVDSGIDFSDYDWDEDGEAEEVFILYAGLGEANGGNANTIWPHMWYLSENDYGKAITLDGTKIDCYACSCELAAGNVVDGIGTFCHEFSHCLGFPDMYDTGGSGNFGMDMWSLMDYGSYNDDGFTPSGYTAYERWAAGWITPVELTADMEVTGLKTVPNGGDAYIIYNDADSDEVMMFENRQQEGWDAAQYGSGLMAYHVDYDEDAWYYNEVNNEANRQRITIFPADGTFTTTQKGLAGDPFPYNENNEFSKSASVKPVWYNENAAGSLYAEFALTGIAKNDDGTVDFKFSAATDVPTSEMFYESFDMNASAGGNDGTNTTSSQAKPKFDNDGWDYNYSYGACQCVKIGSKKNNGWMLSPEIAVGQGDALTWRVLAFNNDEPTMEVSFIDSDTGTETLLKSESLSGTEWTDYAVAFTFGGKGNIKFASYERMFLDEVKVSRPQSTAIKAVETVDGKLSDSRIYSIDGRYMGKELGRLGNGLYIVDGQKVIK